MAIIALMRSAHSFFPMSCEVVRTSSEHDRARLGSMPASYPYIWRRLFLERRNYFTALIEKDHFGEGSTTKWNMQLNEFKCKGGRNCIRKWIPFNTGEKYHPRLMSNRQMKERRASEDTCLSTSTGRLEVMNERRQIKCDKWVRGRRQSSYSHILCHLSTGQQQNSTVDGRG